MRFIQHPETGEFIPAHEYQRPLRQRSDLPSPMLIRDHIDPLQHPADGKFYDSKSQIRAVAKAHNLIEVGTEAQKDNRVRDEVTRDDVGQAIQKLNQGYQPNVQSEALD
jgi:hypothetical protein